MRGEVCVGFGSVLSLAALMLLIFSHVGQINTDSVPRRIYLARVNVSSYGDSMSKAILNDVVGLYSNDSSAPLQEGRGLRQYYDFGLYSYCGYVNSTSDGAVQGICTKSRLGRRFQPYEAFTGDMQANWRLITNNLIPDTTFRDSEYLGNTSRSASWLILIGTIGAAAAFIVGVVRHTWTFFLSAFLAILSSIFVLIGAALWTVLINKTQVINQFVISSSPAAPPLGVEVDTGMGLYLIWAAFACLATSVLPYMISCCTYRG